MAEEQQEQARPKKFETRPRLPAAEKPKIKFIPPQKATDLDGVPVCKVSERDFRPREAARNAYQITVPSGTTLEALLNPLSYGHISYRLAPLDEITVVPADASFYARFLVLYADRHQAKVVKLEWIQIASLNEKDIGDAEYEVKHIPNRDVRWCVIRKADGARIRQGFDSREAAQGWIAANRRILAA